MIVGVFSSEILLQITDRMIGSCGQYFAGWENSAASVTPQWCLVR